MTFILTITARRKNAVRHIVKRSTTMAELMEYAGHINHDRYIVEIYTGSWIKVKEV